jgi:hypothetical protein
MPSDTELFIVDLYTADLGWFRFTTKAIYKMTKTPLTLEEIDYDTALLIARQLDGLMDIMKKCQNGWMS